MSFKFSTSYPRFPKKIPSRVIRTSLRNRNTIIVVLSYRRLYATNYNEKKGYCITKYHKVSFREMQQTQMKAFHYRRLYMASSINNTVVYRCTFFRAPRKPE